MNWRSKYPSYNAMTITTDGVVNPSSLQLYQRSEIYSRDNQRRIYADIQTGRFLYIRAGHLVLDLLKDCGYVDNGKCKWFKIDHGLFNLCAFKLQRWASVIKVQRFLRWAAWKLHRPSLETLKAFQQTSMASVLPDEIFRKVVAEYFKGPTFRAATATSDTRGP